MWVNKDILYRIFNFIIEWLKWIYLYLMIDYFKKCNILCRKLLVSVYMCIIFFYVEKFGLVC